MSDRSVHVHGQRSFTRRRVRGAAFLALMACVSRATATEAETSRAASDPCDSASRRALATAVAVVPGVIVHGAGHFVRCQPAAGRRLLGLEAIGVVSAGGSLAGLAATGASRYVVAPFAIGAWGGVSLLAFTLLADIYGASGLADVTGRSPRETPRLLLQAGLATIYDPHFRYRTLLTQGFRVDTRWLWLAPRFDAALDARNQRLELRAGHRLSGPSSWRASRDGSHLDIELALTDHAYVEDGFALRSAEAAISGRLDLERIAPSLAGSFAESSLGYARQWTVIDGLESDANDELLLRSAFGVYLGRGNVRGEAVLAYDHRRDTFAGGLRPSGIAAGYLGYVEQRTNLFFGRVGVQSEIKYGSALIVGLSLLLKVSP